MKMKLDDVKIEYKKKSFPINESLYKYLDKYQRLANITLTYDDLLRFVDYMPIIDKSGNDTLWLRVFYSHAEFNELALQLNKIYTLLHSDGDTDTLPYLKVDFIEFCTFGNSKPFRIRVRNILNDNYTNYYIKKADASRVYGLELEDMISQNRINYLIYKNTLIEEHILGIPGDVFIKEHLSKCPPLEKSQIAKEFVKFNERCMIGLLGDMRSYNYVIIPIHDFDQVIYRIRAIDFDQQSYEGEFKIYLPQSFKENHEMVKLVYDKLQINSIDQYRKEVRSMIAKNIISNKKRLFELLDIMSDDAIAPVNNVNQLKHSLYKYTYNQHFNVCNSMGDIIKAAFKFVVKNYEKR